MSLTTKSPATTNIRKSLLLSTTAIALCGMLAVNEAHADPVGANELPQGHSTTDSSTTFDYAASGKRLDVKQGNDRIIVDWDSFNIGQNAKVKFNQPNKSSIAVNRVNGNTDPTRIYGSLSANGRLVILDPNGVIFGRKSSVDVGGLIASTGNLQNDNDFLNGDNKFTIVDTDQNPSSRGIVNKGTITVGNGTLSENGLVAFVAPYVKNKGTINAKLGKVTLAAGKKVTVDLTGDQLISIAANSRLQEAIVNNNGKINAQGGEVTLSAYAAKGVVDNVINMNGKIQASGFEETKGGKIILKAKVDGAGSGKIRVAGKMQANGSRDIETSEAGKGGSIDINGETVTITKNAILRARGIYGDGGSINIGTENTQMTKEAIINNGAVLATQSLHSGNGGDITIWARNKTVFNGRAKATATSGNGGSLYITNDGSYLGYNGTIDLVGSGNNGELTLKAENRLSLLGTPDPLYTNSSYVRTGSIGEALINSNVNLIGNSKIVTRGNDHIDFRNASSQSGDLTVTTPWLELNKNKNVVMGDSHLTLNANRIDLNAQILGANGISQLSLSQLTTTTALVQIMSNKASIQQGIDLLNDVDNVDPELRVHYDEYKENFMVNKSINMNGLNRDSKAPVLTAEDTSNPVVKIAAHDVVFNNFDVQADSAARGDQKGLTVQGFNRLNITNSAFSGFDQGVSLDRSKTTSISNSVFVHNNTGLKLDDSNHFMARKNSFTGNGIWSGDRAIVVDGGFNVRTNKNTFVDLKDGLNLTGLTGDTQAHENSFSNVRTGISADDISKLEVTDNTMTGVIYGLKANDIANSLLVARNNIKGRSFSQTGIQVSNSADANIDDNTVSVFGQNGIHVSSNGATRIEDNFVTLTGNDGIKVTGSTPPRREVFEMTPAGSLKIVDNTVFGTLGDGIEVSGRNNALIKGNKVTATGGNGIRLNSSHNTMLLRNMVAGTHKNGIFLNNSDQAKLFGNKTSNTAKNGFFLNNSDDATLMLNASHGAGDNGFSLIQSDNANVFANLITNAGQGSGSGSDYGLFTHGTAFDGNGIMVLGSEGSHIAFNMIINPREDGIKVISSGAVSGDGRPTPSIASISERPRRSRNIRIKKNLILGAGDDGIDLTNVHNAQVSRNIIALAQNNGIEGEYITGSEFNRNIILQPGQNGIDILGGNDLTIDQNLILAAARIGIDEGTPEGGDIRGPRSLDLGHPGEGSYVDNTGISTRYTNDVSITNNTVRNFGKGIAVQGVSDTFVGSNQIHNSSLYGFGAEGSGNRDITLADNNFVNNRTGARFESGIITLEGVNTFTGGETGMVFSPFSFYEGGEGDYYPEPTAYISDGPGYPPFYGSATLELTDNTLGETVFEGQTGNYVTLENGALFNPGTPTVINGIESSFDGVSGAELTTAQLNQIEGKIRDYDDQRTLGQIFVGFVPQDDTVIDQEDVLRQINSLLNIGNNNARVTVTGLPRVPGVTPNMVNALNALQPAAGGEGNGESPEELDALQPAAGGNNDNEAACWNQVGKSIAGGSGGVSYSLGENPQDILSDMAGCDI